MFTDKRVYIDYDSTMFDFASKLEEHINKKYSAGFRMRNIFTYDFNKSLGNMPISELSDVFKGLPKEDIIKEVTEFLTTGTSSYLLGGVRAQDIFNEMSELSLYADSVCLVDKSVLSVFCSRREILPVVNSGIPFSDSTTDILSIKKKRIKELFKSNRYSECYTVGSKPVHGDAFAVIDDDLGYLSRYANAGSNALLLLIDQPYNKFKYNIKYSAFEGKIKRVKDINEALKCVSYKLDNLI